eukprot:GFYU01002562.1.p2 GENE.GFYU01002562.1~~GFYU01002562.1.p2  ORF type:complete len:111 (-),score=22.24 GFYU01002562.1:237-569(-)
MGKRVDPSGLAMSRSFGDNEAHEYGVSATPTISPFVPLKHIEKMIICSDGVWEFFDDDKGVVEAVSMVQSHSAKARPDRSLVAEAQRRWMVEVGNYQDDISCIIVTKTAK